LRVTVKVGLCGFTIAARDYPRRYPVVEVQQTFYQPPAAATLVRWREAMPADFEFTVKAWQLVTHATTSSTYRRLRRPLTDEERATAGYFRASAIVDEGWAATLEAARLVRATAIVLQCPASFRPSDENVANLRGFIARVRRPDGVRLLWEPRGPWPDELIARLCADLDLTHVVDPLVRASVTRGPTYWRLHGTTGAYHVYTDSELARLAAMIPDDGDTYVMFNNVPRPGDSLRFLALLGRAPPGALVPSAPANAGATPGRGRGRPAT
jgi:uncharacterized protein YecE (DUF72 family)